MSDNARNIHLLLKGQSLEVVDQILLNLSEDTIDKLKKISPSTNIDQLSTKVYVMHDVADKLVPSEESKRLADFLVEKGQIYHTEFNLFHPINEIDIEGTISDVQESLELRDVESRDRTHKIIFAYVQYYVRSKRIITMCILFNR